MKWRISKYIFYGDRQASVSGDLFVQRQAGPDGAPSVTVSFDYQEKNLHGAEPELVRQGHEALMTYDPVKGLFTQPILDSWKGLARTVADAITTTNDPAWTTSLGTAWWLKECLPHFFQWANDVIISTNLRRLDNLLTMLPSAVVRKAISAIIHELEEWEMTDDDHLPPGAAAIIKSIDVPGMFIRPKDLLREIDRHYPGQWHYSMTPGGGSQRELKSWRWYSPEGSYGELSCGYFDPAVAEAAFSYHEAPSSEGDCSVRGGTVVFLHRGGQYVVTQGQGGLYTRDAARFLFHETTRPPSDPMLDHFMPALDAWIAATLAK